MFFEEGESYTCFLRDHPTNFITFKVLNLEDLTITAEVLNERGDIQLWEVYDYKFQHGKTLKKIELSPYFWNSETKLIKFLFLGALEERRKFKRYKVKHLSIEVKGEDFRGIINDISIGGLKIDILTYKRLPKPYEDTTLEVFVGKDTYKVNIFPLNVSEKFINAMFLGDSVTSTMLFNSVLTLLNPNRKIKDIFKTFYVEKIPLFVDLPWGTGKVLNISLKGATVELIKRIDSVKESGKSMLLEFYMLGELSRFLTRGKITAAKNNRYSIEFTKLPEHINQLLGKLVEMADKGYEIEARALKIQ